MFRSILGMLALAVCAFAGWGHAFVVAPAAIGGSRMSSMSSVLSDGSWISRPAPTTSLIISQQGEPSVSGSRQRAARRGDLRMEEKKKKKKRGGKVSKFGLFSPAVVGAKVALGESRLNKLRGKVIALHSQVITEYCVWIGAPQKLRGLLIRKAKKNGDDLGFLW